MQAQQQFDDIIVADDTVGIIIPPPEIKAVIDKTAQYVAKNGAAFEKKILETNSSDKFAFLQDDHPFNPYYKRLIDEYFRGAEDEMRDEDEDDDEQPQQQADDTTMDIEQLTEPIITQIISKKADVQFKPSREKPTKDPLTYVYDLSVPPTMTAVEFDIIKLMAQYVAKNGKQFLYQISARENRNPQFEFLKLHHRHFQFFSKLTELYSRILEAPKPSITQEFEDFTWLRFLSEKSNKVALLDRFYAKAEWDNYETERKRKQELQEREEREAFNLIDWHDFVVVDRIDFADDYIASQMEEQQQYDQMAYESNQANIQPHDDSITSSTVENDDNMDQDRSELEDIESKLVRNYPKKGKKAAQGPHVTTQYFKDPTTNQLIPVDKVQDHMRVRTLDQRWKEQKEREMQKFETSNIATDSEITDQLSDFARHRGDIFGKDEIKIGKGQSDQSVVTGSGSASSSSEIDMQQQVLLQQQAAMMAAQAAMSMMNPMMNHPRPPVEGEEPNKRVKLDESVLSDAPTDFSKLVPEQQWIQQFPNGSIQVKVVKAGNEGKGSAAIDISVTDTIDDLKNRIQQVMNIQKVKQKLSTNKVGLLKDDWRTIAAL